MSLTVKELTPVALALGWHSIDSALHMTRPHKRIRMVWAGVGIGWSMFWLARLVMTGRARQFTVIKEWKISD